MIALTAGGHKLIQTAGHTFELKPGALLVTSVEMPSSSVIMEASLENPYLGMVVELERSIIASLISEMQDKPQRTQEQEIPGAWSTEASEPILDAFLRLAKLFHTPEHAAILGPLVIRELHYLLLASPQGDRLRALYHSGGNGIADVITWLKQNTSSPASMPSLARMARMSISSFHRHFKEITGLSPLQYHKKLRLFEAQRLMLAESYRVNEAALAVGYESVTQFNREYRRLFGDAPARDINKRRRQMSGLS